MLLADLTTEQCIPFFVLEHDSETGPRVGGRAPLGIAPLFGEDIRYVMTLTLEPELEVSVFLLKSLDTLFVYNDAEIIFHNNEIFSFIVHGPSIRGTSDMHASDCSPHQIKYLPLVNDTMASRYALKSDMSGPFVTRKREELKPGEEPVLVYLQGPKDLDVSVWELSPASAKLPCFGSKLGGKPRLPNGKQIADLDRELSLEGYRFTIQLSYATPEDWPTADWWPLQDRNMYVYTRQDNDQTEWAFFWQG